MIDRLDISGYVIQQVLHLIPNSSSLEGSVVFELPSEQCRTNEPDAVVGAAILRAAQRCRLGEALVGAGSDSVAKALGFKSNADIRKKLVPIVISRRKGSDNMTISPMRRAKSQVVFTETEFVVSIADSAGIGRFAKEAIKISAAA